MENNVKPISEMKRPKTKLVILSLAIVLIAATAVGTYSWQHSKVKSLSAKVSDLQGQLGVTTKSSSPPTPKQSTTATTFTYSPKTGGLSLKLAKTYGIIVNVDGNKGGAPGATFRVASVVNANTLTDASYQGVQVDVDNTFTTLDHAVQTEESILDDQRGAGSTVNRNYKVSDTTVAGLPAKLLNADGLDEYQGTLSVYLVGSGSFTYTITANGTQNGTSNLLTAVLKGVSIKPVTL